jgi:uncharacterized damage-inducible protein DinB
MGPDQRRLRLVSGTELEQLESYLDFQRDTLLWKVSGLSDEQLRKVWTPSGLSLLGLVKHLAHIEHNWFLHRFAGQQLLEPRTDDDPNPDFRIEPEETTASVVGFYRETIDRAKRIVEEAESPKSIALDPGRRAAVRFVLLHLIEETARHNGHADLMRELTDGQTGE